MLGGADRDGVWGRIHDGRFGFGFAFFLYANEAAVVEEGKSRVDCPGSGRWLEWRGRAPGRRRRLVQGD
jgi:hypothetical protein